MSTIVMTADVFTTAHIAATAAITAALTLVSALAVTRRKDALLDAILIAVITGAAVFLWRRSANMPQLNKDGLRGFSANDWLAPVIVFATLGVERALRRAAPDRRIDRARALAVVAALIVNVVTI